jgi:CBS domain-containing protein
LIGLVTTTDYLREFSYGEMPISRYPVSEWVQDGIEPIDCETTLAEAAAILSQAGADQIGVVNGTLPLGVISMRDLRLATCRMECRLLLGDEMSASGPMTMRELAAKSPTIRPGARLSEAASLMVEHHRQCIAVVTQAGRLVGALSEETLLTAMAGHVIAV